MKTKSKIIILIIVFAGIIFSGGLTHAITTTDWTEYASNPVYAPDKAYYPTILKDGGVYTMWSDNATGVQMATSTDGINWTTAGQTTGLLNPRHSVVEKIGSEYRIWYNDGSDKYLYSIEAIRTATSSGGLAWSNDQPITQVGTTVVSGVWPAWNTGSYGPCDILYNPAGSETITEPSDKASVWANKYVMYYDGTTGGDEYLGLAVSSDGVNWQGYNGGAAPVLDSSPSGWDSGYVAFGTVIKESDNAFHLWYSGGNDSTLNNGIGYAFSTDGINWVKDAGNPIFHRDDGVAWRNNRTYTPMVIGDEMWFTGKDLSSGNYTIGYATATEVPTAITLASFDAKPGNNKVTLKWVTGDETDNLGFNLYRADAKDGEYVQINDSLLASKVGSGLGTSYEFTDSGVQNRTTYSYMLEDVDVNGTATQHGPIAATPRLIYGLFQ